MEDECQAGSHVLDEQAKELLDEYVDGLRAGSAPEQQKIFTRYNGPNPEALMIQLNIFTTLALFGKKRSIKLIEGIEAPKEGKEAFETAYRRVFTGGIKTFGDTTKISDYHGFHY